MKTLLLILIMIAPKIEAAKASWYGKELAGHVMANGRPFDPSKFTCASWRYPLGTRLLVRHKDCTVLVTVTDRGPSKTLRREIDLSSSAFKQLAPLSVGLIEVIVERPE